MSLRVSVDEGHALEVLDLLCRGRKVRITPTRPVTQPRPELAELAARRIAATSLRALAEAGRRERVVLREGRRVRGRLWDEPLNAGFRLRWTAATFELWVQTTQRLAEIARPAQVVEGQGSSKKARRQIRKIVKIADTDTGDWLIYALAYRHLTRAEIPAEIREDLGRRLCLGSPLATLFALEDGLEAAGVTLAEHLDHLVEGPAVRLLECLDDLLVEQWVEQVTAAMRHSPGEARADRLNEVASVLEGLLERLDAHGRLDLCLPLCRALARLLAGPWSGKPEAVSQQVLAGTSFPALARRDEVRKALARVVGLGPRVWALRNQLAREAFGDPRYEEAQVVLAGCDALLRPHLHGLTALASALTGRLG